MHQMRSRNVTFRLGEAVEAIAVADGPTRKAVLGLASGKRIVADMVLLSAGRVPATASLNLAAAGIATDARGRLSVDAQFRTSTPHVFAAGDVLGLPEPGRDLVRAGPARRVRGVRRRGRADGHPLPDRHLRDPGDLDGSAPPSMS